MKKVLVIEDDVTITDLLEIHLTDMDCEVTKAHNGLDGLKLALETEPDLIVLDISMPGMDGLEVCQKVRAQKNTPIIMLTAKSEEIDRVIGLEVGADDYITKPFSMDVLLMRIEAIMRRVDMSKNEKLQKKEFSIRDFTFHPDKRIIERKGDEKKLTVKENELLRLLCVYMGDVVDRDDALNLVWGNNNYFNSRSMDVYITKLRKIFKEDKEIQIINSHGKGFKLIVD